MVELLSVAVLAGGKSRRMGQDKAFLELDGSPLIQHVIRAATPIADEMLVVIGERPAQEFASLGCRIVPDTFPGIGTLGGLFSAIAASKYDYTLVLGCDMPLLDTNLIVHLSTRQRSYDVLIPMIGVDTGDDGGSVKLPQPLHAIYSKRCLTVLGEQIERGQYRVIDALERLRLEVVREDELRRFDPDLRSFFNANTPEALAQAESLLGR